MNPCTDLELPAVGAPRERVETPADFERIIAVLGDDDRALWQTAYYAGLRRGELRGLRWEHIDLKATPATITVQDGWDDVEGRIEPKSKRSRRTVPVPSHLVRVLRERQLGTGRRQGLVFGSTSSSPFAPSNVRHRAVTRWAHANKKRAELELPPIDAIGLHEARHGYVSWLYDAGLSGERVADYAGHAIGGITERYRHTLVGRLEADVKAMDAYLAVALSGAFSGARAAEGASTSGKTQSSETGQ